MVRINQSLLNFCGNLGQHNHISYQEPFYDYCQLAVLTIFVCRLSEAALQNFSILFDPTAIQEPIVLQVHYPRRACSLFRAFNFCCSSSRNLALERSSVKNLWLKALSTNSFTKRILGRALLLAGGGGGTKVIMSMYSLV